jgi:hypothetical protein
MTDKQWHKTIVASCKAYKEAIRLRNIAEDEYKKRYGKFPSDWDDDWWIDTVHYGRGDYDLDKIKESAQSHADG